MYEFRNYLQDCTNERSGKLRLGVYGTGTDSAGGYEASRVKGGRLSGMSYLDAIRQAEDEEQTADSRLQLLAGEETIARIIRLRSSGENIPAALARSPMLSLFTRRCPPPDKVMLITLSFSSILPRQMLFVRSSHTKQIPL